MKALLLAFLLFAPFFAHAGFFGPLVTCGNQLFIAEGCDAPDGEEGYVVVGECTFCNLVELAQNLINFFVAFTVIVATLLFVYAGILYATSASNEGNISKAHSIFWTVFLGLVFVLAAWLIVDLVMKAFYGNWNDPDPAKQGQWGPWNKIICPTDTTAAARCRYLNVDAANPITPTTTAPITCYEVTEPIGGGDPLARRDVRCCFASPGTECTPTLQADVQRPGVTLKSACAEFPGGAFPLGCPARTIGGSCPRAPGGGYSTEDCSQCTAELVSICEQEKAIRDQLAQMGYVVNKGFCHPNTPFSDTTHNPGGCTNVGHLSGNTTIALLNIMNDCNSVIGGCTGTRITGGSELGHAGENADHTACVAAVAHCAGNKVDIGHTAAIDAFVQSDAFTGTSCHGRPGRTHVLTGSCWTTDEGDHYDIYFD